MNEVSGSNEILEVKKPEFDNFKEIKPEGNITTEEAKGFIDNLFVQFEDYETAERDNPEDNIEKVLQDYFNNLKEKSECSETIPEKPFYVTDLNKRTPEENAEMREEFADKKIQLKKEWEEANGRPWPKYDHDIYSANGKLIRKAGSDYDAHHIQPLGMGGKNEASNITPLSAKVHYDKQGIHSPDSPYSKLDFMLGGL